MKTSKIIAAAALSILAAAGAQAETYQGVQAPVSAN
ncbi:MAG: alpha/beta hydrolase, partial [Variovorax sp.]